jgi:hypothetical protein
VNRRILMIVLVLAVVLLATPYIGMVQATPSTPVSGTIEFTSVAPAGPPLTAGESDNVIRMFNIIEEWSGGIAGTGNTEAKWIIHNAPLFTNPDAWVIAHAIITFSDVTILGLSGTLTIELVISGTDGHWTIMEGTGELANVHGQGTGSTATEPYTYTGLVHFDP